MKIQLDGNAIANEKALYAFFNEAFGRTDITGIDELWDYLTIDAARPIAVEWQNWQTSERIMKNFGRIVAILREVEKLDSDLGKVERFKLRLV